MATPAGPSTRIIAFMNQKGGVGKTTTTVNLGAALAEQGSRVLFIDLDPQAHLTLHLGVDPTDVDASVYDLLVDGETSVESVAIDLGDGMALLPAEVDLAAAEQDLGAMVDRHRVLGGKIKPLISQYDFVLMDCPPSLGMLTLNALATANEVIVPMQAHFLALQGLSKLLETIQLVRQNVNTQLRVSGVVLCVHDGQTNLASEVVNDLEQFFNASRKLAMPWSQAVIFQPPIRRNIKLAECPSFGQTIMQYDAACAGANDYRALGQAVLAAAPGATRKPVPAATPTSAATAATPAPVAEAPTHDEPAEPEPAAAAPSPEPVVEAAPVAESPAPIASETPFTDGPAAYTDGPAEAAEPAPQPAIEAEPHSTAVNADQPAAAPESPAAQPAPQPHAAPAPPLQASPLLKRLANPYAELIRPAIDTRVEIPPPAKQPQQHGSAPAHAAQHIPSEAESHT